MFISFEELIYLVIQLGLVNNVFEEKRMCYNCNGKVSWVLKYILVVLFEYYL